MKGAQFLFFPLAWITFADCNNPTSKKEDRVIHINHIVDLTHTLTAEFPYIPVKNLTYPFKLIPMATLKDNGVAANSWHIHEHLGTHIDAPNHFINDQKSVDQIALQDLIVPVEVIDIEEKASKNRDAELTVGDLEQFESKNGRIPEHSCVIMYSGWEKHLKDSLFVGLDDRQVKHYPGFSNAAIQFLIKERNIAGIGVDVLSFDPGIDENYTGHKTLFAAGKWGVECVANLSKIPPTGATIIVGAPKVGQATGGFSRIIAVW
ncbi:MAG TPA: cyclase family protein [Puia sp.]|nr:cyclase family protein [Puia sp.]